MNKNIKIIIGITILLILMFFVGKCSNSHETIIKTITLPANGTLGLSFGTSWKLEYNRMRQAASY